MERVCWVHGPCNGTWYGTGFVQMRFVLRLRLWIRNASPGSSSCVARLASALRQVWSPVKYQTRMSNNCVVGSKNSRLSDLFKLVPPVIPLVSPLPINVTGCGYVELATVYPLACTLCASALVGTNPGT